MSAVVTCEVSVNTKAIEDKLSSLFKDDVTMFEIHNIFAKMMHPYVPYLHGPLSLSGMANVTAEGVTYSTPYAHKQYYLHDMAADMAGETNRTRTVHPKATSYWDKAMMLEQGDLFIKQVRDILVRRAKELYG